MCGKQTPGSSYEALGFAPGKRGCPEGLVDKLLLKLLVVGVAVPEPAGGTRAGRVAVRPDRVDRAAARLHADDRAPAAVLGVEVDLEAN